MEFKSSVEVADDAIRKMNERITDEVFLTIQNDRELMGAYLRAVQEEGLDRVNQTVGRAVKKAYGLENKEREGEPESTLIRSHMMFE
ncbi:hypothetical protein STSP2_00213 [Anaerohalosphaera lusitana]|uniref:Uncharacterized protein n=1 Tax=Anaerohalosphaera lusitana TaxID=1936003 RepID=A0A1U9NGL1_9BACT|nr:hypothetical protein [Anaerohalosphaera lusitana]AQT67073.1 hypothetical protein STSP2_00213 [Anaerohalosphaera lusitana]